MNERFKTGGTNVTPAIRVCDHDLAVLRREVAGDPERFGGPEALQPLLARIDRRRQKLERDAVILGRKVFRDPPQTFGRRLRGYWKTGHD